MFFLSVMSLWASVYYAGKGLASWLSFVVSNCEFVTSPLVSSLTIFNNTTFLSCVI